MTKNEALRLALEALKSKDGWGSSVRDAKEKAIAACEAALEAKDEPVAYVETKEVHGQMCSFIYRADSTKLLPDGTKLYTTPLQRKPLSDEEIEKLFLSATARTHLDAAIAFARAIEAAHEIKERN